MKRGHIIFLSFFFVILTGFFFWLFAIRVKNENSGDSRSEIEKILAEEKKLSEKKDGVSNAPKTASAPQNSALTQPVSKTSQTAPPQPQAKPASSELENNPAENQESQPKEDPLGIPTDWENFRSDKLGISLRHPAGVQTEETDQALKIKKDNENWLVFRVYKNEKKLTLEEWFGDNFKKKENTDCQFLSSELKIGRLETKNIKSSDEKGKCANAGFYALDLSAGVIGVFVDEEKNSDQEIRKIAESLERL